MPQTYLDVALLRRRLRQCPSLQEQSNPILLAAQQGGCRAEGVATALGQYCLLPRHIAELLTLAASRIGRHWPKLSQELRRNVGEEMGDQTFGQPHFHILKSCLKQELGLDLDRVDEGRASASFIADLTERLKEGARPDVAGVVAALEDSATPELQIVARIINCYAEVAGLGRTPIESAVLASEDRLEEIWTRARGGFNLEDFFALHILHFEAGHSDGLAKAIAPYLTTPGQFDEFLAAYQATLEAMDRWWVGMATEAGLK